MLQFMRSQGIGHDLVTEKQQSSRSSQSCLLSAHTSSTSSLVSAHLTLCSRHTEILAVSACLIQAVCSASNAFNPSFLTLTPFHSSGLSLPGCPRLGSSHCCWVGSFISPHLLQDVLGLLVWEIHCPPIVSLPVSMTDTPPPPAHGMGLTCCSVTRMCPSLCNPMDCSTPSFCVLHCLLEFA